MNVHARIPLSDGLYDRDGYRWSQEQAALIRAGRWSEIDLENVAEEIESLSRSHKGALSSQISRVIEHLWKLKYGRDFNPRRGWVLSVVDARAQIERNLDDNPSLRPQLGEIIGRETEKTRRYLLRRFKYADSLNLAGPIEADREPFTVDQVVGDWFPPEVSAAERQ